MTDTNPMLQGIIDEHLAAEIVSLRASRERLRIALRMISNFHQGRGMSLAECANLARATLDDDENAVRSVASA